MVHRKTFAIDLHDFLSGEGRHASELAGQHNVSGIGASYLGFGIEADRFASVYDNQAGSRVVVRIVTAPKSLRPEPVDASVRDRMADVVQDQHRVLFDNTQTRRLSRGSFFFFFQQCLCNGQPSVLPGPSVRKRCRLIFNQWLSRQKPAAPHIYQLRRHVRTRV